MTESMSVRVPERAHGTNGFQEWLLAFNGKEICSPQHPLYYPEAQFIRWHIKEVFRGPANIYGTPVIDTATALHIANGPACSTGSLDYSHVLSAMQVPYDYIAGSIRFSFSYLNCPEDAKTIVEKMKQIMV